MSLYNLKWIPTTNWKCKFLLKSLRNDNRLDFHIYFYRSGRQSSILGAKEILINLISSQPNNVNI